GRPGRLIGLVQGGQCEVGEQRTDDASLRRAGGPSFQPAKFGQHTGLQERLTQVDYLAVGDASTDPLDDGAVPDVVEAAFDVAFNRPRVAVVDVVHDLGYRVLRSASRSVGVAGPVLVGLEDGFQYELERHLHHPVGNGGDPEPADLAALLRD